MSETDLFPDDLLKCIRTVGFRSERSQRIKSKDLRVARQRVSSEIRDDVEKHYALVRDLLKYKRKQLETCTSEEGFGSIRTPEFVYSVSAAVCSSDASLVNWEREVTSLENVELLMEESFQAVFNDLFDTLVCELGAPLDLAALIDDIEERSPPGVRLRYDSQCTWCEMMAESLPVIIRVLPDRITIRPQALAGEQGLQAFHAVFSYLSQALSRIRIHLSPAL